MSWQKAVVNLGLRYVVKPYVGKTPFSLKSVRRSRKLLARSSRRLPLPADVYFNQLPMNGVNADYFISKNYRKLVHSGAIKLNPEESSYGNHSDRRVLLYFHGGGYVTCSPATHRGLTSRLAKHAQCEVFAINYRKAPENPYPAALDDAIAAYQYLLDQGISADRIIFAGDSAGGNLTLATLLKVREMSLPMPASAICLSPWTDLTCSSDSFQRNWHKEAMLPPAQIKRAAEMFMGDGESKDPMISPAFANLSGLPPLMVHVGTTEVLYCDSLRLKENAERDGVDLEFGECSNRLVYIYI